MTARDVLVTGAARGIGRALAERLAARGDRVYAADVDAAGLADLARAARVTPVPMDVTDEASVSAAVDGVVARAGGLDAVVNVAGVFVGAPWSDLPERDLRRVVDINVLGVVRVTRACFAPLRARRGRVVILGSEAGRFAAPFNGPYAMTKHAIEAYADSLRREWMLVGVPVTVIQPGAVRTPLLDGVRAAYAPYLASSPFRGPLRRIEGQMAAEAKRACAPEVVADAVIKALDAARPRARYRVNDHPWRSLVERLPAEVADRAIFRYLGGRID